MSKNRSREQAKRRFTRVEAQRLCAGLNAKEKRRTPGASKHPEAAHTHTYYVGADNVIRRVRIRERSLDQIDESKLALAFWLMAKRMTEEEDAEKAPAIEPHYLHSEGLKARRMLVFTWRRIIILAFI